MWGPVICASKKRHPVPPQTSMPKVADLSYLELIISKICIMYSFSACKYRVARNTGFLYLDNICLALRTDIVHHGRLMKGSANPEARSHDAVTYPVGAELVCLPTLVHVGARFPCLDTECGLLPPACGQGRTLIAGGTRHTGGLTIHRSVLASLL